MARHISVDAVAQAARNEAAEACKERPWRFHEGERPQRRVRVRIDAPVSDEENGGRIIWIDASRLGVRTPRRAGDRGELEIAGPVARRQKSHRMGAQRAIAVIEKESWWVHVGDSILVARNNGAMNGDGSSWAGRGKVRAREIDGGVEIALDGITTQARYYKLLVYEFFRKEYSVRPRWGDFEVEIVMEHVGEAPRLDLDNLAKALLDALKGFVFFDDSQIARLVCERRAGARDAIVVRAWRREATIS